MASSEGMKSLTELYEDPDEETVAEEILKSSQALKMLQDDLVNQVINMFEFVLIYTFYSALSHKMRANWEEHKFKARQVYTYDNEGSLQSGNSQLKRWQQQAILL
ncbi:unnamed protein product [Lepeophtheirus salmonis]|uniref:(salmon louse) hypothetical protein n=1 Tax=Lepeophtheirus salmonis TaxID=72036 RepID=A0A7R8CVY1_LEPSM|nr:unnamed protein product [Lepeophtheirus salmonis]CAF2915416.1 unnamed protein product [Lepeophtheirus salmonis]